MIEPGGGVVEHCAIALLVPMNMEPAAVASEANTSRSFFTGITPAICGVDRVQPNRDDAEHTTAGPRE